MLDPEHVQTRYSIRELWSIVKEKRRPIVFWFGAGVSRWCGYPSWAGLASDFHSSFKRLEPKYVTAKAAKALKKSNYPAVFQEAKIANAQSYFSLLVKSLAPRAPNATYERFIKEIRGVQAKFVITTNVDETVERSIPEISTLQYSAIEQCKNLIFQNESFVLKLHGTASDIERSIFTTDDYANVVQNKFFQHHLQQIFEISSVIFVGYGLRDQYVLKSISSADKFNQLFGTGPHFAILPTVDHYLPPSVRVIKYISGIHEDHRTAIRIIGEVNLAHSRETVNIASKPPTGLISAHLLTNVLPVGTTTTSQSFEIVNNKGEKHRATTGTGLTNVESPQPVSSTMQDIVVGLTCFDRIYVPSDELSLFSGCIGSYWFEELIRSDCLRFLSPGGRDAVIYPGQKLTGSLQTLALCRHVESASCEQPWPEAPIESVSDSIRRHIHAAPGKATQYEAIVDTITKNTHELKNPIINEVVRGMLLYPSTRKLLGISEGMQISEIPPWYEFMILRLASVVRYGIASNELGIASTSLEVGHAGLAEPVFSGIRGNEWADDVASYVIAGNLKGNVGAYVSQNPQVLGILLRFRDSMQGIELRREVLQKISVQGGADVVTSINAGLSSFVKTEVLQNAHEQMQRLMVGGSRTNLPAVWKYPQLSSRALELWRERAAARFCEHCVKLQLVGSSLCPCGSGDKVKDCCGLSLGVPKGRWND